MGASPKPMSAQVADLDVDLSEHDRVVLRALADALLEFEQIRARLQSAAQVLADDMARLQRRVDKGQTINSLGEVQGRGADVDRLCALLGAAQTVVLRTGHMARQLGLPIPDAGALVAPAVRCVMEPATLPGIVRSLEQTGRASLGELQLAATREELQRTWIIRVASPGHIASLPVQCDSLEEALLAALEYFGRRNGDKSRIWG